MLNTGWFQVTCATFTIPTCPSVANLLIPGTVNQVNEFQPLLYLHELSDTPALEQCLKGGKPNLKPGKERSMGQLPEPYLAVRPEGNSSMSILEKHIKGIALSESHIWPGALE